MSDERPWEDFADPLAQPAKPADDPGVGYTEDIAKGAAGGLGRGTAGLIGLPGTVGGLIRSGLSKAGVSDETLDKGASWAKQLPVAQLFTNPDGAEVQKGIEKYTGEFYKPKTLPGQYASTIAEFAPGALIPGGGGVAARVFNTVAGGVASETAGQMTKDTAAEPWARAIGGVVGAPVMGSLLTPSAPVSAARQAAISTFEREGIPLTAGQRTGSKPIQWAESTAADMPGSAGRAAEMKAAQDAAYNKAVTNRMFDPAELRARGVPEGVNLPDPRVVRAGKESLQDKYTSLTQGNELRSDPKLQSDLLAAQTKYEKSVMPSQRTHDVEAIRNDIVDALVQGQGRMPGDVYQATRSQLGTNAKSAAASPYLSGALKDMRGALDEAMARGLSPDDAKAWALNNRRYANMKQTEQAVAAAGENLSPQRVEQSVRSGRAGQYAAQTGDLDELSKASGILIRPMPNSGTTARAGWQQLFNLPAVLSAGGGGAAGAVAGGPLGAAIGATLPFAASRAVVSRPGQAYLGNQVLPQNTRDIVTQALAQQAISQPGGIATNQANRAAYEEKRREDLRESGLE